MLFFSTSKSKMVIDSLVKQGMYVGGILLHKFIYCLKSAQAQARQQIFGNNCCHEIALLGDR